MTGKLPKRPYAVWPQLQLYQVPALSEQLQKDALIPIGVLRRYPPWGCNQ